MPILSAFKEFEEVKPCQKDIQLEVDGLRTVPAVVARTSASMQQSGESG